jgi:hypothetical protein
MKRQTTVLIGAISLGALSLGGGTLLACNKSPDAAEKKPEAKVAATEEKKASKPAPPPVDEGIDVPTEEDFEEAATAQISETSDLQKELDRLEKEIGN